MSKEETQFTPDFLRSLPRFENYTDEMAMETIRSLENAKNEPLTREKFRSFTGCEHYTDEEAEEIISSLEQFCHILLEAVFDLDRIGAYDKDGNIIQDHPELVRRRDAVLGKPKEYKKRGRKKLSEKENDKSI